MASKYFDPHTSFLHLPVVKCTTITLVAISLLFCVVIVFNSEVRWDFSYDGFNHFLVVFRFPLGILALIIPIIALLAANHRSEQTKEQIRVTNDQNIFSNYYKHFEEFSKYVDNHKSEDIKILDVDVRYAHGVIFPHANNGDYSISENVVKVIDSLVNMPHDIFLNVPENLGGEIDSDYKSKLISILRDGLLCLNQKGNDYIFTTLEDVDFTNKRYSNSYVIVSKWVILKGISILRAIVSLCEYYPEYKAPSDFGHCLELKKMKTVYLLSELGTQKAQGKKNPSDFDNAESIYVQLKNTYLRAIETKGNMDV